MDFQRLVQALTRFLLWAGFVGQAVTHGAAPAAAQDEYPTRPVHIVTNAGIGSSPDVLIRIVAGELSRLWGQQVVIENNSAGGGVAAAHQAARAPADGYTLLSASASMFIVLPIHHERAPVVIGAHLKPIAFLGALPMAFAVSPKLGVASIEELIELSQREPRRIFYAANQTGSLPHMTGERFKSRTGASLTFVPYRGAADALTGVMSGQIDMIIENYMSLNGAIQSGDLVLLAFSATERLPNLPDVPTIIESAPDFIAIGWAALMAPAGAPDFIVDKVNADVQRIFDQPDIRRRMLELVNYPVHMTPAELTHFIKREQDQWGPVVRSILAAPSPTPAEEAR